MTIVRDLLEYPVVFLGSMIGHHAGGGFGTSGLPPGRGSGERLGPYNTLGSPALLDTELGLQPDRPAVDDAPQDLDHRILLVQFGPFSGFRVFNRFSCVRPQVKACIEDNAWRSTLRPP